MRRLDHLPTALLLAAAAAVPVAAVAAALAPSADQAVMAAFMQRWAIAFLPLVPLALAAAPALGRLRRTDRPGA